MKRLIFLSLAILLTSALLNGQDRVVGNKPYSTLNSNAGFITINELTMGIGLGDVSVPYSKSFFGITSVNGYLINKSFLIGIGAGLTFYNGGMLAPLFLDFRYSFNTSPLTPYVFADGGLLINFSDFGGTKMFINPGGGVRYTFSRKIAVNLGVGFLAQSGGASRDTFINIKAGVVYKF